MGSWNPTFAAKNAAKMGHPAGNVIKCNDLPTSVSASESSSPRDIPQSSQDCTVGTAFDGNFAGLVTSRTGGLSQNAAGRNYTGWTSSHPHSPAAGRGC